MVLAVTVAVGGVGTYYLLNRTSLEYGGRREGSNVARATAIMTALQDIAQHPVVGTGSWNVNEEQMNRHRANTSDLGGKYVASGMALGSCKFCRQPLKGEFRGSLFHLLPDLPGAGFVVGGEASARPFLCVRYVQSADVPVALSAQPQGGGQRLEIAQRVSASVS